MAENIELDEKGLQKIKEAARGLIDGTLPAAEVRDTIVAEGKKVFGPYEKAIQEGTARIPGFVLCDDEGYDLELAQRSVGKGWHEILAKLWATKPPLVRVEQVKEKFGGLRIYYGAIDGPVERWTEDQVTAYLDFEEAVARAESEAYRTCEICGEPGKPREGGWIKTLCDKHAEGRESIGMDEEVP